MEESYALGDRGRADFQLLTCCSYLSRTFGGNSIIAADVDIDAGTAAGKETGKSGCLHEQAETVTPYFCSAEEKVRLGHQHLVVHVLDRRPVTFIAVDSHFQVNRCDLLRLQAGMADVTLIVPIRFLISRFFSLRFIRETDSKYPGRSCDGQYRPHNIGVGSLF